MICNFHQTILDLSKPRAGPGWQKARFLLIPKYLCPPINSTEPTKLDPIQTRLGLGPVRSSFLSLFFQAAKTSATPDPKWVLSQAYFAQVWTIDKRKLRPIKHICCLCAWLYKIPLSRAESEHLQAVQFGEPTTRFCRGKTPRLGQRERRRNLQA